MNLTREIEKKYGLIFIENSSENLCFITKNSELRNEFKQFFTQTDVNSFIKSFNTHKIELPNTVELFWAMVLKGCLVK